MFTHLFIDSLNALLSQFETNTFHILTTAQAKLSDKMETFTMEMLAFKGELYSQICKLIKSWGKQNGSTKGEKQSISKLNSEIEGNKQKLYRYRLHAILKRKAIKKQRQSILAVQSTLSPTRELQQLQKSILLIQKDLGIENEGDQNQKLGITKIINKSLSLGLDSTPISKMVINQSLISNSESSFMDKTDRSIEFELNQSRTKQNQEANRSSIDQEGKSLLMIKKVIAKKKKVVVSKVEGREGLLGNLLQETYNQLGKK